ncbi:MAG: DUF4932 domain-containing protein [Bacteroidota bacterium]
MKRLFIVFFIGAVAASGLSQNIVLKPVVDERTELMSIVFRLAGSKEYMNQDIRRYSDSIDIWFKPYKNDPVVSFARKLRTFHFVAYDAVMSMAVHLDIDKGTVRLKHGIRQGSIDKRWGDTGDKFVLLLNDFYRKSDFHTFFLSKKALFIVAETRFSKIANTVDLAWYEKFFGSKPAWTFNLLISPGNGGENYGQRIMLDNGHEEVYSIMGTWATDSLGFPVYDAKIQETIVHEFCHSFCNPPGTKYFPELKTVAGKFYKLVKENMEKQAYGDSQTMIYEILVRACVIAYYRDHGAKPARINQLIRAEQASGFLWIQELTDALGRYEASRDRYPTFDSFMPEIISLQNGLAPDEVFRETVENRPRIINFSVKNNSREVDPGTNALVLTFDRPMSKISYGMTYGNGGKPCYPKITSINWNPEKNNELIITWELEPNHRYSIKFPAPLMMDEKGFYLKETYMLDFKTKK